MLSWCWWYLLYNLYAHINKFLHHNFSDVSASIFLIVDSVHKCFQKSIAHNNCDLIWQTSTIMHVNPTLRQISKCSKNENKILKHMQIVGKKRFLQSAYIFNTFNFRFHVCQETSLKLCFGNCSSVSVLCCIAFLLFCPLLTTGRICVCLQHD